MDRIDIKRFVASSNNNCVFIYILRGTANSHSTPKNNPAMLQKKTRKKNAKKKTNLNEKITH